MKATLTITSKRQVTIPKKIWDKLNLEGARYLAADVKNGKLELKKVSFDERFTQFWDKTHNAVKGELSDASIKQAARKARRKSKLSE